MNQKKQSLSIFENKCSESFKKQCKIDETFGLDRCFSRIFEQLFTRIRLSGYYQARIWKI